MQVSVNAPVKGLVRLWLALVVVSVASLDDVGDFAVRQPHPSFSLVGLACVAVLKASALTALYAAARRVSWLRIAVAVMIALFVGLSLLNGFCWLFYGFGISMKLLKILAETNPTEVGEFMPELADRFLSLCRSWEAWLSAAVFVALWRWLPRMGGRWLPWGALALSGCGAVYLAFVFATAPFGRASHIVFARSARCAVKYVRDAARMRRLQAMKRPLPYGSTLSSRYAARRVVVVIGESASRGHMSLYGYPLPTTPRLDSIGSRLLVFSDAVASSTSTAENMPRLMTFMTDEPDTKEWYEYPSVLQMFRHLGYRTYWLSNQEYSGQWSNLSSILSQDADVLEYVGSMDSDDHFLYRFDDVLLPEWDRAVAASDSLQLTFLHLMGSHFQYENRFPPSRRRFSGSDVVSAMPRKWLDSRKAGVVADYDNSILYTDSLLSRVIADVGRMPEPALLIYVSDHGEDVYDDRDFRGRDPKFVDVPFFIYANDAYRRLNPAVIEAVGEARRRPFSTSELPHILMSLTGSSYRLYDSVRDPLSSSFRPRIRWVDEEPYFRDAP